MSAPAAIAVDLLLLRAGLPDLPLRPGALLMARVSERHEGRGLLMLAQAALVAELPDGVEAGDTLRLAVHDVQDGRALLRIVPDPPSGVTPPATPPPPPPVALPLPSGGHASLAVDEEERTAAAAEGRQVVALSYASPALGALDLSLELHAGGISVRVRPDAAGPAHALATAGAAELQDAIAAATGRRAQVAVAPRPFEAYA